MHLSELKSLHVSQLIEMAYRLEIESANRLRKQELMFAILKKRARTGETIFGDGTLEVLPDGFGFLRSPKLPIWQALMIFISARRKSGALICIPAIRLRAKCARLKTASAISRWSRLTRSTVFRLRPQNIKSCLRTSHRCIQIRL